MMKAIWAAQQASPVQNSTVEKPVSLLEMQEWYEAPGDTDCYSITGMQMANTHLIAYHMGDSLLEMSSFKRQTELLMTHRRHMNFSLGSQYKAFILAQFICQSHCIMQFLSVQSMQQVASKWQALAQHSEANIK